MAADEEDDADENEVETTNNSTMQVDATLKWIEI